MVMPPAFTAPTAPQAFPAFHSRRPSHTTAALRHAARKAPAHCLAPGVALAEMSPYDYMLVERPTALPLSQILLCKLPSKALPRRGSGPVPPLCCPPVAPAQSPQACLATPAASPCPLAFSDCGCSSGERSPLRITQSLSFKRRVGAAPITPQWVLLAGTQGSVTLAL